MSMLFTGDETLFEVAKKGKQRKFVHDSRVPFKVLHRLQLSFFSV
jgi:hypothetical protein